MAPTKRKQNAPRQPHPTHPQHQQQHQQQQQQHRRLPSEQAGHETDPAYLTDPTSTMQQAHQPPPLRTNTELNLSVLTRYHPTIRSILSIAPFAVVYTYSAEAGTWEKIGVEGTGFVCLLSEPQQRQGQGQEQRHSFAFVILNRKSLDTFSIPLERVSSPDDIEITDEYIIVPVVDDDSTATDADGAGAVVYGIWIFDEAAETTGMEDGRAAQMPSVSVREAVAAKIVECAVLAALGEAEETRDNSAYGWGEPHESAPATANEAQYDQLEQEESGRPAVPEYNLDGQSIRARGPADMGPMQQGAGERIDLMTLFGNGNGNKAQIPSSYNNGGQAPTWQQQPQQQHQQQQQQQQQTQRGATINPSFQEPAQRMPPQELQAPEQPSSRFFNTADTGFFQTSKTPYAAQSTQAPPPQQQQQPAHLLQPQQQPQQQSALLDLFKSAKKG